MTPPRTVSFTVTGVARPKGSTRSWRHPATGAIITGPASGGLKGWESAVRAQAQRLAEQRVFFGGPVRLLVTFTFARPKSVSVKKRAYMVVAPDLSKLVRGIEDAMTGVLYRDDSQITEIVARKVYGVSDEPSHALITLSELEPMQAARPLIAHQEATYGETKAG
jgi:Holliday junction resolvase RusA-like endonuclease